MKFWIPLILCSSLLACLPKRPENSASKATVETCYKDFFATIEGKKVIDEMRAANLERSGLSMQRFGLGGTKNYLEAIYRTNSLADEAVGSRWKFLNALNLYGYHKAWIKWGMPDTFEATKIKLERVLEFIHIIRTLPAQDFNIRSLPSASIEARKDYLIKNLEAFSSHIISSRDEIARILQLNSQALSNAKKTREIGILDSAIEKNFQQIEETILQFKKANTYMWPSIVESHRLNSQLELSSARETLARLEADEDFLIAVSRFITAPPGSLIRYQSIQPLSQNVNKNMMFRGIDGTPVVFRSYVFVEGTRDPVFDMLHDKGVYAIVFFDGADGLEKQMIFISKDATGSNSINKASATALGLSDEQFNTLQKWQPDSPIPLSMGGHQQKSLSVVKLDKVAPDRAARVAKSLADGDDCPICLDDLSGGAGIFDCPHCCKVFHKGCMLSWAGSAAKVSCPNCRHGLEFSELAE